MPTGEVVAIFANDAMRIGGLYDVTARFAGAVVSFVVVGAILLRTSRPLGLVVLLGVPGAARLLASRAAAAAAPGARSARRPAS